MYKVHFILLFNRTIIYGMFIDFVNNYLKNYINHNF